MDAFSQLCIRLLLLHDAQARIAGTDYLSQLIVREELSTKIATELVKYKFVENVLERLDEDSIKRFESLFVFLIDKGMFRKEHMLMVWNSFMINLNEDLAKWILRLIKSLLPYCKEDLLTTLGENLRKVKNYNKYFLELLGIFSKYAQVFQSELFDLNYMWSMIFDIKLPANLKSIALDSFINALTSQSKLEYIAYAGINFFDNVNIELSIKFLLKVKFISCFNKKSEAENFIIQKNLIQRCIDSCTKFHIEAKKLPEIIPQTGLSLIAQAKLYLDFLQVICVGYESCQLTKSQLDALWGNYCKEPFSNEVADLFWNALSHDSQRHAIGFFSTRALATNFYKSYLVNTKELEKMNLSRAAFNCLRKYFELYNNSIRGYEDLEKCLGLDTLWMIALTAKDFRVQMIAIDYIMDLYYTAIKVTPKKTEAIENCLDRMIESTYSNIKELKSILHVLNKFTIK